LREAATFTVDALRFTFVAIVFILFSLTCPWGLRPHQRWEVIPNGRLS